MFSRLFFSPPGHRFRSRGAPDPESCDATPPQWTDGALEWTAAAGLAVATAWSLSRDDLTAAAILGLCAFFCARRASTRIALGLPTVWIVVIHVGGREITCWHSRDEQYSRQAAARILAAVLGSTP